MPPLNGFDGPTYLYGILMGWILGFICGLGGNKMTNSEVKRSIEAEQKAIKRCEEVVREQRRAVYQECAQIADEHVHTPGDCCFCGFMIRDAIRQRATRLEMRDHDKEA